MLGGDLIKKYEKEAIQAQLDNEKEVLKRLEANYKDALEEIDSKIAELMGRADADMQHVVYQVDYQRALKAQIQGILANLQSNEFTTVSEYLTKCYDEGFLSAMYSLQSQGVPLVIPMNQEEIAAAIQLETNLSSGLYKAFDTKELQKKIASEISRGFSTGSTFSEIARNVAAYAGISRNNAKRIVRTEGHRIMETAAYHAQQKAKDRGADVVKVWDASLDARTRPTHAKVDGEVKELNEKFSNGLKYPGDPSGSAAEVINCRCRSRTDARWALDAEQTKMLGDTSKMKPAQRKAIAEKIGVDEQDLDQYSGQIVPIKAKNYSDFKEQYNKLWRYEDSELKKEAEERIAGYEKAAKKSAKTLEKTGKTDYNASENDDIESLSLRFLSNRDQVYKNLVNVPPLDGYEDIACHADPYSFGYKDPETDETVQEASAKEFAKRVRESGKYNGGAIRLIACESGKLEDGLAQKFADEMGEEVLAPTKIVFTNSQGYMVLADDDLEAVELLRNAKEKWNPEGWITFKPKGG